MRVRRVHYRRLLQQPGEEADKVFTFPEAPLDRAAMPAQIDSSLDRQEHD
jgi:hypothetical protein